MMNLLWKIKRNKWSLKYLVLILLALEKGKKAFVFDFGTRRTESDFDQLNIEGYGWIILNCDEVERSRSQSNTIRHKYQIEFKSRMNDFYNPRKGEFWNTSKSEYPSQTIIGRHTASFARSSVHFDMKNANDFDFNYES